MRFIDACWLPSRFLLWQPPRRKLGASTLRRYELLEINSISCLRHLHMKQLIRFLLLAVGITTSRCTFAHGGISSAGEFGTFIAITAVGWIFSSVYLGIMLKKITGNKWYILASPFIPWLLISLMILGAALIAVLIDSLLRINSSLAESIGLFISLAFQLLICALVIWKVKQKLIKQLASHVAVPMVLASYLWVEAFAI